MGEVHRRDVDFPVLRRDTGGYRFGSNRQVKNERGYAQLARIIMIRRV